MSEEVPRPPGEANLNIYLSLSLACISVNDKVPDLY